MQRRAPGRWELRSPASRSSATRARSRLSPIFPFSLLNYTLGLTRVSWRAYLAASAIGMLPGTFLYVYLGSLVTSVTALASGQRPATGAWTQVFYWVGLGATVAVTILVTRIARRALGRALDP